jgi:ATP-dependent Clp endopeptidase proteolytic subunit ClpP
MRRITLFGEPMKKTVNDDIEKFHDYSIHLPTRTLYMGSEHVSETDDFAESGCDTSMAERMVKNIHILDHLSQEPITILMNNIGGDEYHGFAIYDAIKAAKSEVTIIVMGHAMSMGSIILQAADKRVMAPTSRQMIHYGTWGQNDHAKTAQKIAQEGLKIDQWMENMYLDKLREKDSSFKLKKLQKMLDHDTFLTAEQSVALGLADSILGDEDES